MADNKLYDKDGYVYEKKGIGYEQQWDVWQQQPTREHVERENNPRGYLADGTPIFQRRSSSNGSSGSGSGGGGELILLLLGLLLVFGLLALIFNALAGYTRLILITIRAKRWFAAMVLATTPIIIVVIAITIAIEFYIPERTRIEFLEEAKTA